jgi:hypothetical protein
VTPDFDDIVGLDVERAERERLRRAHELIVQAGPPPELPPQLEQGPTLAMTLGRQKSRGSRKVALLAAALSLLAVAFLVGYLAGNRGSGLASPRVLDLHGTQVAPRALASLELLPADPAGNVPMTLSATRLPKSTPKDYYEVWLVRDGKVWAPCGSFVAKGGDEEAVHVSLNAPYQVKKGDTWIVTRHRWGTPGRGPVVLRPTT